jgi:hypothetical protein
MRRRGQCFAENDGLRPLFSVKNFTKGYAAFLSHRNPQLLIITR